MKPRCVNSSIGVALACWSALCLASPSQTGQTGFIQMPSGRLEADGTLQFGVSAEPVYQALWANVTVLPWMEVSARYTRVAGVNGGLGAAYGDYKDKAFDAKWRLLPEGVYYPSLVYGVQDFLGTGIFEAHYLAVAKRFANVDVSLGYGKKRIDGWFGGVRYDVEAVKGLAVSAEYNAFDYPRDPGALASGVAARDKGVGLALDYRWGWLGSQLSWQDRRWGMNAYLSVPLQAADFIPKLDEPKPYMESHTRPSDSQWLGQPAYRQRLLLALRTQDYIRVGIDYEGKALRLRLSNSRIAHMSRAIGRAARTALALGPIEAESLEIVYTQADIPVATVTFTDLQTLNGYYQGVVGGATLLNSVSTRYAHATDMNGYIESDGLLVGLTEGPKLAPDPTGSGHLLSAEGRNSSWYDSIALVPRAGFYFNDPSGALHYEIVAEASWVKQFAHGRVMDVAIGYTVLTDIDEVKQPSNSRLPHVRSDIAKYRQGGAFKLARAMFNQVYPFGERFYARGGIGLYEEMYGGAGLQGMYVWPGSKVALDVAVDALKQRDYSNALSFLDYSPLTAIASLHVRLPYGLTTTLRGGRFLAGDEGVRLEVKRRFRSGYEVGFWYTQTNGNDITTPGSPGSPYQDKGVYFSVPLNTLLTRDTPAEGSYRLRPWTRDGGQMVSSAFDLYEVLEKPLMLDYPELRQKLNELGNR